MAELVAVGCGPGDPELLTVKAVNAIKRADVIACPVAKEGKQSLALSVVSPILEGGSSDDDEAAKNQPEILNLVFPMTKDRNVLEITWKENSKLIAQKVQSGKNVVYLTVGDPYLYSTWIYLHRELEANYPEIKISVIPGIVSMFTFASKVGVSLAEGAEKVTVIPSCYDLSTVKELARNSDTMVFLKDGRYFDQVIELLKEAGFSDDSLFAIGQDLGTDQEIVRKMKFGDVTKETMTTKYFSIMVIKRV